MSYEKIRNVPQGRPEEVSRNQGPEERPVRDSLSLEDLIRGEACNTSIDNFIKKFVKPRCRQGLRGYRCAIPLQEVYDAMDKQGCSRDWYAWLEQNNFPRPEPLPPKMPELPPKIINIVQEDEDDPYTLALVVPDMEPGYIYSIKFFDDDEFGEKDGIPEGQPRIKAQKFYLYLMQITARLWWEGDGELAEEYEAWKHARYFSGVPELQKKKDFLVYKAKELAGIKE